MTIALPSLFGISARECTRITAEYILLGRLRERRSRNRRKKDTITPAMSNRGMVRGRLAPKGWYRHRNTLRWARAKLFVFECR